MTATEASDLLDTPRPHGPQELIRQASRHALGIRFLVCAPFETVAVTFRVHPDLVLAAREILERLGISPDPSGDPEEQE